ncbi:MAG TPA: adenylate kinase [Thermomicrobiales bacterium]|nr:adenylate kinase [Thermomicrobiales bacterium]
MNAILLGPQGVGKGTQGEIVAPQLRLVRIATGDLLRAAIRSGSALGQQAQTYYDRGALVPDEIVVGMVVEKLQEAGAAEPPYQGALFDGFPRNRSQAESLDAALKPISQQIDRVVNIDAPRDVLIARVTARVTCGNCGTIYNLQTNPPRQAGVCDVCGSTDLRRRADDTEEALRERLRLYDEQTEPLLAYYQQRGIVREVNGDQPIARVTDDVLAALR